MVAMKVEPIKSPIIKPNDDLQQVLRAVLPPLKERSILAVTSKVVALAEGRVKQIKTGDQDEKYRLVRDEADFYLEADVSQYEMMLTVKHSLLAVNAGIDQSNANDKYVLLPEDPYQAAENIWQFLRTEYQLEEVGVLITDSKTFPLKWGTLGTALAHCGFEALNNHIGKPDLFGRPIKVTQVNVAEGLAAAAVVEMGERDEAQPFCLINQAQAVEFTQQPPTKQELEQLAIPLEDDVYGPLLTAVNWKKKD